MLIKNKKGQYPNNLKGARGPEKNTNKRKMNKKGQMGETITWVVATIIVVVILGISISILSLNYDSRRIIIPITSDLFAAKSLTGYLSTDNVYNELVNSGEFSELNGGLASNIFYGIYRDKVLGVWVGFPGGIVERSENDFFSINDELYVKGLRGNLIYESLFVSEKVILDEDKSFEVYIVY